MRKTKKQVEGLHVSGLGFKSAFKATMGFYLAQTIAFLGMLSIIGAVLTTLFFVAKWWLF